MTPFPWAEAMRLGFGVLRLSPDAFWHMSPRELAAAAEGLGGVVTGGRAIDRTRFDELQKRFPDLSSHQDQKNG